MFEAADDFAKEIKLHPYSLTAYPALVQLQSVRGQRKEMEATLRGWVAAAPSDPRPVSLLMNSLLEDGDAKAAVAEGEAALKRLAADGKNDGVRIALGQAYLKVGDRDDGQAALEAVLKKTEDARRR